MDGQNILFLDSFRHASPNNVDVVRFKLPNGGKACVKQIVIGVSGTPMPHIGQGLTFPLDFTLEVYADRRPALPNPNVTPSSSAGSLIRDPRLRRSSSFTEPAESSVGPSNEGVDEGVELLSSYEQIAKQLVTSNDTVIAFATSVPTGTLIFKGSYTVLTIAVIGKVLNLPQKSNAVQSVSSPSAPVLDDPNPSGKPVKRIRLSASGVKTPLISAPPPVAKKPLLASPPSHLSPHTPSSSVKVEPNFSTALTTPALLATPSSGVSSKRNFAQSSVSSLSSSAVSKEVEEYDYSKLPTSPISDDENGWPPPPYQRLGSICSVPYIGSMAPMVDQPSDLDIIASQTTDVNLTGYSAVCAQALVHLCESEYEILPLIACTTGLTDFPPPPTRINGVKEENREDDDFSADKRPPPTNGDLLMIAVENLTVSLLEKDTDCDVPPFLALPELTEFIEAQETVESILRCDLESLSKELPPSVKEDILGTLIRCALFSFKCAMRTFLPNPDDPALPHDQPALFVMTVRQLKFALRVISLTVNGLASVFCPASPDICFNLLPSSKLFDLATTCSALIASQRIVVPLKTKLLHFIRSVILRDDTGLSAKLCSELRETLLHALTDCGGGQVSSDCLKKAIISTCNHLEIVRLSRSCFEVLQVFTKDDCAIGPARLTLTPQMTSALTRRLQNIDRILNFPEEFFDDERGNEDDHRVSTCNASRSLRRDLARLCLSTGALHKVLAVLVRVVFSSTGKIEEWDRSCSEQLRCVVKKLFVTLIERCPYACWHLSSFDTLTESLQKVIDSPNVVPTRIAILKRVFVQCCVVKLVDLFLVATKTNDINVVSLAGCLNLFATVIRLCQADTRFFRDDISTVLASLSSPMLFREFIDRVEVLQGVNDKATAAREVFCQLMEIAADATSPHDLVFMGHFLQYSPQVMASNVDSIDIFGLRDVVEPWFRLKPCNLGNPDVDWVACVDLIGTASSFGTLISPCLATCLVVLRSAFIHSTPRTNATKASLAILQSDAWSIWIPKLLRKCTDLLVCSNQGEVNFVVRIILSCVNLIKEVCGCISCVTTSEDSVINRADPNPNFCPGQDDIFDGLKAVHAVLVGSLDDTTFLSVSVKTELHSVIASIFTSPGCWHMHDLFTNLTDPISCASSRQALVSSIMLVDSVLDKQSTQAALVLNVKINDKRSKSLLESLRIFVELCIRSDNPVVQRLLRSFVVRLSVSNPDTCAFVLVDSLVAIQQSLREYIKLLRQDSSWDDVDLSLVKGGPVVSMTLFAWLLSDILFDFQAQCPKRVSSSSSFSFTPPTFHTCFLKFLARVSAVEEMFFLVGKLCNLTGFVPHHKDSVAGYPAYRTALLSFSLRLIRYLDTLQENGVHHVYADSRAIALKMVFVCVTGSLPLLLTRNLVPDVRVANSPLIHFVSRALASFCVYDWPKSPSSSPYRNFLYEFWFELCRWTNSNCSSSTSTIVTDATKNERDLFQAVSPIHQWISCLWPVTDYQPYHFESSDHSGSVANKFGSITILSVSDNTALKHLLLFIAYAFQIDLKGGSNGLSAGRHLANVVGWPLPESDIATVYRRYLESTHPLTRLSGLRRSEEGENNRPLVSIARCLHSVVSTTCSTDKPRSSDAIFQTTRKLGTMIEALQDSIPPSQRCDPDAFLSMVKPHYDKPTTTQNLLQKQSAYNEVSSFEERFRLQDLDSQAQSNQCIEENESLKARAHSIIETRRNDDPSIVGWTQTVDNSFIARTIHHSLNKNALSLRIVGGSGTTPTAKQDLFRRRIPNSARAPSMHVDDFAKLQNATTTNTET